MEQVFENLAEIKLFFEQDALRIVNEVTWSVYKYEKLDN